MVPLYRNGLSRFKSVLDGAKSRARTPLQSGAVMRWNKSTRFALYAAMEMARAKGAPVTAQSVAERYGISANHLQKVLAQLVRSGIARGTRGVGGGYRLARGAEEVTLLSVVEAIEGPRAAGCPIQDAGVDCPTTSVCGLGGVFQTIADQTLSVLGGTTLADVLRRSPAHRRLPSSR